MIGGWHHPLRAYHQGAPRGSCLLCAVSHDFEILRARAGASARGQEIADHAKRHARALPGDGPGFGIDDGINIPRGAACGRGLSPRRGRRVRACRPIGYDDAWTTWFGRRRDEDAPCVNAPTWDYTGAVNARRRPIRKFQMKKPAASFPARARLSRCTILATMDIGR